MYSVVRIGQLLVVSLSDLLNTCFPIQSLSDRLVCLHELVEFLSKLLILVGYDSDVVVERVDLDLQIGVVVEQG